MFSFFRSWRERGWSSISAEDYSAAWHRWGGSVATHPDFVARLSELSSISVAYLGWLVDGELQAVIAVWGRHLALSKSGLKQHNKRRFFDLGNAEVIIPQAAGSQVSVRHQVRYVSELNHGRISTLKQQQEGLALARKPEDYSKKFRYNQRRELRLLEEQGGKILPFTELSSAEQAAMYIDLFEKRWDFAAPGKEHLAEVLEQLRPFVTGSFICIDELPAAAQILYRVESPEWISVEYINGGVDPQFSAHSPGSVLSFVNTQAEWAYAREQNKPLRYSFGRADREYKGRWCNTAPVYEVR